VSHDLVAAFLRSLTDAQRKAALFRFDDQERLRWQYTPGRRGGLSLKDMNASQRDRAMALVESALSPSGASTAREIMNRETILRRLEERVDDPGSGRREPERYYFSVFGSPSSSRPWAWRVGGHHLCLHFTVVADAVVSTPLFFGANPARLPNRHKGARRLLAPEEERARELLASLDGGQRRRAVVSSAQPADILTGNAARAEIVRVPIGIGYGELSPHQQRRFGALVSTYIARVRHPVEVDLEELSFAWAGSTEVGGGHYYAVRGSTFIIEYDNTQNDANHIHTVWRDAAADWGADLLATHYLDFHS
jgi:uncharacterized protein DUF3500